MQRHRLREMALRDALSRFDDSPIERWADPLRPVPTPRRSHWRAGQGGDTGSSEGFHQYRRYYHLALVAAVRICVTHRQSAGFDEAQVRIRAHLAAAAALRWR